MVFLNKARALLTKASNSNTVINVVLMGSFATLSWRSWDQQKTMEALEAEKKSLLQSNKEIQKSLWDWKQNLYAEAASPETALVPLAKLKAIYGEAPASIQSNAAEGGGKAAATSAKIVI